MTAAPASLSELTSVALAPASELLGRGGAGAAGFVATWLAVGTAVWAAHRARPARDPLLAPYDPLERYRLQLAPFRRVLLWGVPTVVPGLVGLAAAASWRVGDLLVAVVALALAAGLAVHYLSGAVSLHPRWQGRHVTPGAARQLGVLGAALALATGLQLHLARLQLAPPADPGGHHAADALVRSTMLDVLALSAVVVAAVVLWSGWRHRWRLAAASIALLALTAVVGLGVVPAVVEGRGAWTPPDPAPVGRFASAPGML